MTLARSLPASARRSQRGHGSSNTQGVSLGAFNVWSRTHVPTGPRRNSRHEPELSFEGPVRAIISRGPRAWIAGGRGDPWLSVFSTASLIELDSWDCSEVGICTVMTAMDLPDGGGASAEASGRNGGSGRLALSASKGTTASRETSGALGLNPAGSGGLQGTYDGVDSWRLLTGHENGQVLMWSPNSGRLQPMLKIGDLGSPIR